MKHSIYLSFVISLISGAALAGDVGPSTSGGHEPVVVEKGSEIICVVLGEAQAAALRVAQDSGDLVKLYFSQMQQESTSQSEGAAALNTATKLQSATVKRDRAKAKFDALEKAIKDAQCEKGMVALGMRIAVAKQVLKESKPMSDLLAQD